MSLPTFGWGKRTVVSVVLKCNHPRCLTCPLLKQGQSNYAFTSTKDKRRTHVPLNCKSKNLIYGLIYRYYPLNTKTKYLRVQNSPKCELNRPGLTRRSVKGMYTKLCFATFWLLRYWWSIMHMLLTHTGWAGCDDHSHRQNEECIKSFTNSTPRKHCGIQY